MMRLLLVVVVSFVCSLSFAQEAPIRTAAKKSLYSIFEYGKQTMTTVAACGTEVITRLQAGHPLNADVFQNLSQKCIDEVSKSRSFRTLVTQDGRSLFEAISTSPDFKELQTIVEEKGEDGVNSVYNIVVTSQDENSVVISGDSPASNTFISIYEEGPSGNPGLVEQASATLSTGNQPRWSQRVYFRDGRGPYQLKIFMTVPAPEQGLIYKTPIGQISTQATVSSKPEETPSFFVQSDAPSIKAFAKQLTAKAANPRAAAVAIHEWVSKNIAYDWEFVKVMAASNGRPFETPASALTTLRTRKGVCLDFSTLEVALLRAAGIPARVVSGLGGEDAVSTALAQPKVKFAANHAWVQAYIDGRWANLDSTWESVEEGLQYFDVPNEVFAKDHINGEIELTF